MPEGLITKDPVPGDKANSGLISLAKELARAIMYMLVPESALPALV